MSRATATTEKKPAVRKGRKKKAATAESTIAMATITDDAAVAEAAEATTAEPPFVDAPTQPAAPSDFDKALANYLAHWSARLADSERWTGSRTNPAEYGEYRGESSAQRSRRMAALAAAEAGNVMALHEELRWIKPAALAAAGIAIPE